MMFDWKILTLKKGDITAQNVDIIVNAANSQLAGGGGVDGAIHRKGGPGIMEECDKIRAKIGRLPTGEAVITGAGALQARYVIHTVGPIWAGGKKNENEQLGYAYLNSLKIASEYDATTIAFPSISTGAYGFPIKKAAVIALNAVKNFCMANSHSLKEVRFVLFSAADLAVYQEVLTSLLH
ncbi:O-acetyl-ADP-ribose deacetylase [Candidatus Riflebacteria bacterium]